MSTWSDVDAMVRAHKQRMAELVALAKEGGVYRKPRFTPPPCLDSQDERSGGCRV